MKRLILVALLLITFAAVWFGCSKEEEKETAGTIFGVVKDYATDSLLEEVSVTLGSHSCLTGSDNRYVFTVNAGKYKLSFSKAGYENYEEDIEVEAGKSKSHDVKIKRQVPLKTTDINTGNPITLLDLGKDENHKSFNIFNDGKEKIECTIHDPECSWIDSVRPTKAILNNYGDTKRITVYINRAKLPEGTKSARLIIESNKGSKELLITAIGYGVPSVKTYYVYSYGVTATTATCEGEITSDGGSEITDCGFCWATTNSPSFKNGETSHLGPRTGTFSKTLSGLTPNTVYYVRAYATNKRDTVYGNEETFTTGDETPIVSTKDEISIKGDSLILGGTINDNRGFRIIERGICYGTNPNLTLSSGHHKPANTEKDDFYSTIPYELGYFRAYATNENGITGYGKVYQVPEYVDLGLSSGTKWKSTNASGFYTYDEAVSAYGKNLPTKAQWEELKGQCTWSWTGSGYKVTGPNGNSIMLPAEGHRDCAGSIDGVGSIGFYWSSTPNGSDEAWCIGFNYSGSRATKMYSNSRCNSYPIRLVKK